MQKSLDTYDAGIWVTDVKMQDASSRTTCAPLISTSQKALADQDRKRNEAETYANRIVPRPAARPPRSFRMPRPTASRSLRRLRAAPSVSSRSIRNTRRPRKSRAGAIYLETMSQVLAPLNQGGRG